MAFLDVLGDIVSAGFDGIEAFGRGIDKTVTAGLDVLGNVEDAVVEFGRENPITATVVGTIAAGVATGGLAYVAAPAIAASLGSVGLLGAASTGTAISSLSGAALTNASLAAVGGGAIAAGGGGMAAGVTVVATSGAVAGAVGTSTVAAIKTVA